MAKYGNNKGKKYRKLIGGEVATKDSLRAARAFMGWYGLRFEELRDRLIYAHKFDDEVATDTALKIYDDIALKGTVINGKYKWYYFRAYHTNYIAAKKLEQKETAQTISYDAPPINDYEGDGYIVAAQDTYAYVNGLAAPDFDADAFESATDLLRAEILEYVRANYAEENVSIFEIYMELLPEISYKKLAVLFGMPHQKIWQAIGEIKRDVSIRFGARRDYLLSII